ncbi:hypothetical protein D3C84_1088130 [compost metagenome]
MLRTAENDFRNAHVDQAHAHERISLTQHRRPTERMQPTPIDMSGLTFDVEQLSIAALDTLHATFAAATDVGFFNPLTALIPEIVKAVLGSDVRFCCTLHCH